MKRLLIALMAIAFVAATAPTVWAQGEPSPPRSDVKSGNKKPGTSQQNNGKQKLQIKKPTTKLPQ